MNSIFATSFFSERLLKTIYQINYGHGGGNGLVALRNNLR